MEDSAGFVNLLEAALAKRRKQFDEKELPGLRASLRLYQTAFQGIRGILLKKSLIHEDPYKYDFKISDIGIPPTTHFTEIEAAEQLSIRLSQFESYLDFLVNYYQFNADFLGPGRVKKIGELLQYFNFERLFELHNDCNTAALGRLVDSVRKGGDEISVAIVQDSVGRLAKSSREVAAVFRQLGAYHREKYKLELRKAVLAGLAQEPGFASEKREAALLRMRQKFAKLGGRQALFQTELAAEVLDEDYSAEGPRLREAVLARLDTADKARVPQAEQPPPRNLLVEAFRTLAPAAHYLSESLAKLNENCLILDARETGLGAKLAKLLHRLFSPREEKREFRVEIIDPASNQRRMELLDFIRFSRALEKKIKLLRAFGGYSGTPAEDAAAAAERLRTAPEDRLYALLQSLLEELNLALRNLTALDEFFKKEAMPLERSKLKGIKVELTAIKGALTRANQKRHDYMALREEREQMKRLGVQEGLS